MSLDKIVVIVLGLLFFGGLILLAMKGQQAKASAEKLSSDSAEKTSPEQRSPDKLPRGQRKTP